MTLDLTAELATPLVVAGAVAGLVLGRRRIWPLRIEPWTAGAALAVFLLFAAPIVLSGSATFAGYTILGDTAVHFVLVDRIATHGTSLAGLGPSSYRTTLEAYFNSGYPLGAHAALAAVRPLAFTDVAWVFQPFLACIAAALALTLAGMLESVVASPWRRAAVAALASQPPLAYAFAMQGSVKELATLWLVALFTTLAVQRRVAALAVAAAAGLAAIGLAVAAWLGPVLLAGLVLLALAPPRDSRRTALTALGFAIGVLVLSLPTLLDLGDYLDVTQTVVTTQQELGNLFAPLKLEQVVGIWLRGDYRALPGGDRLQLTHALVGVAVASGVGGLFWLIRRRALGPLLFFVVSMIALAYVTWKGSPWADAKALAIASPAVLLMAALGPVALDAHGLRAPAGVVAGIVAGGVVVSNALIYHEVSLAPRERLAELQDVADATAGRGPLLYTEFEEFGKHFLRDSDPVGATEALTVPGLTPINSDGSPPRFGYPAELSALRPEDVERFRTLVLRRDPLAEPPSPQFRREWRGRWYEIWSRDRGVRAGAAPPRGAVEFPTAERPLPGGWTRRTDDPSLVETVGPGTISGSVQVKREGEYEVWLRGSFGRAVEVVIDGRRTGSARDELAQPANWLKLGSLKLSRGEHRLQLVRGGASLAPGNGDGPRTLGELVLRRGVSPAP